MNTQPPEIESTLELRCPACACTLSKKEQQIGVCNRCGRVFDLGELLSRQEDRRKQKRVDRRTIFAERLTAATGMIMMVTGLFLISFSKVGIAQLLSNWGAGTTIATIAAIVRQRVYEEPLFPVLLVFGGIWLFFGLFCWGVP